MGRQVRTYWGLLGPEDHGEPEIFFRDEERARQSYDEVMADVPGAREMLRLVKLRVSFEVIE